MSATQLTFLITTTFKVCIRCYAEHNLSFHGHSCKISDPDNGFSWVFLSVLRLHRLLALHLQKKYWLFFIHFHHKMPLKFNLRASTLQIFWRGMPPDPPSISMLHMLIVVLCTVNSTSNFTLYKGPHLYFMPQAP